MSEKLVFPLLTAEQIEVKVKQVSEKGAVALLYKTARTDMDMLDKVVGAMSWRVEYSEIKGNLYCTLYIRDESTGEWVGKQDCGIESRSDSDGNEKKGEASDAFKRAGFRWGIGRELYTAPFIFLSVPTKKGQGNKFELEKRFESFSVSSITYDENRRICGLEIINSKGYLVFSTSRKIVTDETGEGSAPQSAPTHDAGGEEATRKGRNANRLQAFEQLLASYQVEKDTCEIAVAALRDQGIVTKKNMADMSDSEFSIFMIELEKRLKSAA